MLIQVAKKLFEELQRTENTVVFVESCTAGLASAGLGRFPGVSKVLHGSIVVYQTQAKLDWLDLPSDKMLAPELGPVSPWATGLLAERGLAKSPAASIAAAVTGHLGPSASIAQYEFERLNCQDVNSRKLPADDDGVVYVAIADRTNAVTCQRFKLKSPSPKSVEDHVARYERQIEATILVYQCLLDQLQRIN